MPFLRCHHRPTSGAWSIPLLLFVSTTLIYSTGGRLDDIGDSFPARYLPLSILREFDLDLDEFSFLHREWVDYYLQYRNGHFVSTFPVGAALLATPIYLLPVLWGISPQSPWMPFLEKSSARIIAALSVVFLYLALRRLTSARQALLITLLYALGTSTFSVSSQALWQHGSAQLFLTLTIYFLVRGLHERQFVAPAGFTTMTMVFCRPTNVLVGLPILLYVLHRHRREVIGFVICALPVLLFLLDYNRYYFGAFFDTGYGKPLANPSSFWWQNSFSDGLLWILISPHRGLLIYSPIFLFSFVGMWLFWKWKMEPLFKYLSMAPFLLMLLFARMNWSGGWSYGPRYFADVTPILSLSLFPVFQLANRHTYLKWSLGVLAAVSISMHAIGALGYDTSWDSALVEDSYRDRYWSWTDSPFRQYAKLATRDLMQKYDLVKQTILRLPDSLGAPAELAAALDVQGMPDGVATYEPFVLSVNAMNTGRAIWLARSHGKRGGVRVMWRWLKDGQELANAVDSVPIAHDVFPGEAETMAVRIWPPLQPGQYSLELQMMSYGMSSFGNSVSQTLQITSPLTNGVHCAFETILDQLLSPAAQSVTVGLATDKALYRGEDVGTLLWSVHAELSRALASYFVLQRPDGTLSFAFTSDSSSAHCSPWMRWGIGFSVWKGMRLEEYPIVALRMQNLPPGPYTWYFFVTEPNSYHVLAKAKTTFLLMP
jgi:Dolichyl-phosphate-mannose-protein mannosyltransferase